MPNMNFIISFVQIHDDQRFTLSLITLKVCLTILGHSLKISLIVKYDTLASPILIGKPKD